MFCGTQFQMIIHISQSWNRIKYLYLFWFPWCNYSKYRERNVAQKYLENFDQPGAEESVEFFSNPISFWKRLKISLSCSIRREYRYILDWTRVERGVKLSPNFSLPNFPQNQESSVGTLQFEFHISGSEKMVKEPFPK